ncbi:hypothetical protein A3Q56_02209 [Intoshia linei]|uniref:CCHC-type domain-containing protein n=1 Tax=Intoshia linei TaxID=1819745 RepID=A0A177B8Q8_9BILA|nr:hypothetical protein A3Q56_02209 [Intoshia linei]
MDINSTIEDEVMSGLGSHQPEGDLPQKDIDQSPKQEVSNSIINALEMGDQDGSLKLIISKKERERITSILGNEYGNVDLWIKVLLKRLGSFDRLNKSFVLFKTRITRGKKIKDAAREMGADIRDAIPGFTDKQVEGFVEQEVLYCVQQVKPDVVMIARMWARPGGVDLRSETFCEPTRKMRSKSQLQCHQCEEYGHIARKCSEDTRLWKEKLINGSRSEWGM